MFDAPLRREIASNRFEGIELSTMIEPILRKAIEAKASDVHIHAGVAPLFRVNTAITPSNLPLVTAETAQEMARRMMSDQRWVTFQQYRDADFSHEIPGLGRFRVNVHFQRGSVALSIRLVDGRVRPISQLFLPEIVEQLTHGRRGLILVTGPAGSGKSTTLAAMIDAINRDRHGHIVTLEDPIEYVLTGQKCAIEQRELGADVPTFASGLRHALRQDPDVILLGEMRDLDTTRAAITAAETGHLVLSTLHTINAAQTIERIIDIYPTNEQPHVRLMLANTLQAVISQTLLKRSDEPGLIPATEVMICNPAVRTCIRENRVLEIANVIETSRSQGMQSLDTSIKQLFQTGYITREDALASAAYPEKLERALAA